MIQVQPILFPILISKHLIPIHLFCFNIAPPIPSI